MIENFGFEVDFLPVGSGSKSGDAIALRFGEYQNGQWKNQTIFVIDGGDSNSGDALVKHIQEVYKSDFVDRVILTHPDGDHASGLRNVVKELKVGKIWMHRPWNHWAELKSSIIDSRVTEKSFGERLRASYQYAHEIERLAIEKKIEIFAPHQGRVFKNNNEPILRILGPGKDLYLSLVQSSEKSPHLENAFNTTKSFSNGKKTIAYENMSFETEHLSEEHEATSPENDMSLILLLTVGGVKVLFTGDAGTMGLYNAIRYATSQNINLRDLNLLDVPHHGSRRNLSKGILEYIHAEYGIISCAANSEKHPSSIVTNSLLRRGITPYSTKRSKITWHNQLIQQRQGYNSATPIPFSNQVEIPVQ
jgi:beta-lactamase superfamily II metal-dependent hydrolase